MEIGCGESLLALWFHFEGQQPLDLLQALVLKRQYAADCVDGAALVHLPRHFSLFLFEVFLLLFRKRLPDSLIPFFY